MTNRLNKLNAFEAIHTEELMAVDGGLIFTAIAGAVILGGTKVKGSILGTAVIVDIASAIALGWIAG
ncbi:MAG: ComC/BlpC family leader-containing pheromone/bacteriocin [Turicibacter sp.]|nr:ComC/BlpC family leader-containing pheromone/bacteriocin [Turicibacter sp.]